MKPLTPHPPRIESDLDRIESDRPLASPSTRQRVARGCARGDLIDDDDDGDDDGESGGGVR